MFNIKSREFLTRLCLKSDVSLLTCVFEKILEVSFNEFGIKPLFCVTLPGYTWQCALKYTGKNLQTLQDKDLFLTLRNNIRAGISSVMGDRYAKSDENDKIFRIDATILLSHSMSQPIPFDESEMWHGHPGLYMKKIDDLLNTPDDSDICFFVEVELRYPDIVNE